MVKLSAFGDFRGEPETFFILPLVRFKWKPQIASVGPVPPQLGEPVSPISYKNLPEGSLRANRPQPAMPLSRYVGTPVVVFNFHLSVVMLQPVKQNESVTQK